MASLVLNLKLPAPRWKPLDMDSLDQLNSGQQWWQGICCLAPGFSNFMRLKSPRVVAKNQEGPTSRTEGTKQLSSSPG